MVLIGRWSTDVDVKEGARWAVAEEREALLGGVAPCITSYPVKTRRPRWTSGGERARAHDILIKAGAERLKNLLSSATELWRESEQTLPLYLNSCKCILSFKSDNISETSTRPLIITTSVPPCRPFIDKTNFKDQYRPFTCSSNQRKFQTLFQTNCQFVVKY